MLPILKNSVALSVISLALFASHAMGSIEINLNTPFPNSPTTLKPDPDGAPPWLIAVFEQVGANQVQLSLTANLVNGNDVRGGQGGGPVHWGWGFNFNPAKDVTDLVFLLVSGNGADKIEKSADEYKPDGLASVFDILMGWSNTESFSGSDTAVYDISLTGGGLVEADFDFFSNPIVEGNEGVFRSAAHVQNISSPLADSTWIGDFDGDGRMPEPASVIVWAALCAIMLVHRPSAKAT
jgi:hypothetical protein